MTYTPTTWQDSPSTATPITAAELNRMEAGIVAAHVRFASTRRTAGDYTINSTTFVDIAGGSALDVTVPAAAGDLVEAYMAYRVQGGTGLYVVADLATVVAGSPVNSVTSSSPVGSGLANSFPGWSRGRTQSAFDVDSGSYIQGALLYTVQAGDISAGSVTFRPRVFTGGSVTISASDPFFYVSVKNLGQ